jgi:hypothetical protein
MYPELRALSRKNATVNQSIRRKDRRSRNPQRLYAWPLVTDQDGRKGDDKVWSAGRLAERGRNDHASDMGGVTKNDEHILPFAAPMIVVGGQGFAIRHNSAQIVNATGAVEFEEG